MCYKLIQTYACDHTKVICTTPCPHALAPSSARKSVDLASILRSNSTVSSIAPSSRRGAVAADPLPSSADVSPMPGVTSLPGKSLQPDLSPLHDEFPRPAFRIKIDNPPAAPFSAAPTSSHVHAAPADHAAEAQPEQLVQPVYCSYYFPHYLVQSRRPCRECYLQPEWEGVRRRWVESYRIDHPMEKPEDLERSTELKM